MGFYSVLLSIQIDTAVPNRDPSRGFCRITATFAVIPFRLSAALARMAVVERPNTSVRRYDAGRFQTSFCEFKPTMKTVCLFDIDGTLLNAGGAGQDAMEQALLDVFSVTGPYADIPAAGRTDKAITTDLFSHHAIEVDEQNWSLFLNSYIGHLPRSLAAREGVVLPGVVELLDELSRRDDVVLGLLTGNLEVGANLKLKHYGIDHHFRFGGYGDVHFDRDDVARLAHTAATQYLQNPVHPDRLWVIGDTPADVKCGRAIGARVIAVTTGIHSRDELAPFQPDYLFENLADVEQVLTALIG